MPLNEALYVAEQMSMIRLHIEKQKKALLIEWCNASKHEIMEIIQKSSVRQIEFVIRPAKEMLPEQLADKVFNELNITVGYSPAPRRLFDIENHPNMDNAFKCWLGATLCAFTIWFVGFSQSIIGYIASVAAVCFIVLFQYFLIKRIYK